MTTTTAEAPEWALHINAKNCRRSFMVTDDGAWVSNGHWMVRRETVPELVKLNTAAEILAWGLGRVQPPERHPDDQTMRVSMDGEPLGDDILPLDRFCTTPASAVETFWREAGETELARLRWTPMTISGGRVFVMDGRLVLLDDEYVSAIRRTDWYGRDQEAPVFDTPLAKDATVVLMPMRGVGRDWYFGRNDVDLQLLANLLIEESGRARG